MSDEEYECNTTASLVSSSLVAVVEVVSSAQPPQPPPQTQHPDATPLTTVVGGSNVDRNTTIDDEEEEKRSKRRTLKRHLKQRRHIRKCEMRWLQACGRKDEAIQIQAIQELKKYLIQLQSEPDSLWYHYCHPPQEQESESLLLLPLPQAYHDFLQDPSATTIPIQHDIEESYSLCQARLWMTKEIWQKLVNRMLPETVPASSYRRKQQQQQQQQEKSRNHADSGDSGGNDEMVVATNNKLPSSSVSSMSSSPSSSSARSKKLTQTLQARPLLSHMTKGTQTESMFENDAALIGYTRQKFMERAVLTFKSLERLAGLGSLSLPSPDSPPPPTPLPLPWESLLRQVRSIVSIGCGPGCDAVGVLTFLQHMGREWGQGGEREEMATTNGVVDRVLLMDFVMPQWKRLVIDHLESIICPIFGGTMTVETASCDVRYSLLHDERNSRAAHWIGDCPTIDLVVVSYLLTETRDQWEQFFRDLLDSLTKSCLFLLSEPTAWQLHSFTSHFAEYIEEHAWVDSSQPFPDLQPLEGRMGPAVLVLHVRPKRIKIAG
jgi:hypothetical protein